MRHDQVMRDKWQQCVDFNDRFPIGSSFVYRANSETPPRVCQTSSHAYVMLDNCVVGLSGVNTPVPFEKITTEGVVRGG